jgi:hypothetical protein
MQSWRYVLRPAIPVLLLICVGIVPVPAAANPPASYHIALLHVTYSDTTAIYTPAQLKAAAGEIHNYYEQISYGQIDLSVTPVEVTLPKKQEFYFDQCLPAPQEKRVPCPPTLIEDAAQAAAAGGFSFTGINGISVLSTFCSGDWTNESILISRPGVNGTFGRSYDFECSGPAPGSSGVLWGGWTHEFGHQLEVATYGSAAFNWGTGGHPSGYLSGYDLMDSCYPCDAGAYSLLGPPVVNGNEHVFGGWLHTPNVVVVKAPTSGTTSKTVTLTPLEENFTAKKANQAIQVPVSSGIYYLIEARQPILSDLLQNNGAPPRGIYDSGVHILQIEEAGDPPVRIVNACDTTVAGGCVTTSADPRYASCSGPTRQAYCWPFDLWHVGETYNDAGSGIAIKVKSKVGNGFEVTVTRGVTAGHPHDFIKPWLTLPMNTYETEDIWVDSSCNGYESDVGPKGLLYGRRADGTVIGNGDDPCANHENRIYATIQNRGDLPASNVTVHFQVSDPLGIGVTGSWAVVGTVTIPSLPAGKKKTVYTTWTPNVTLTKAQIGKAFSFHSCVQVFVDPVPGEIASSGHLAQENFANFYSETDPKKKAYPPIHGKFFVSLKDRPIQTVFLNTRSALPAGWTYQVAGGEEAVTVGPNTPFVEIPADIQIPEGAPVGQSYELSVQALALTEMVNEAIPAGSPVSHTHRGMKEVGGVVLSARGVYTSGITLTATTDSSGAIKATGTLDPAESTVVAVDFTDGLGETFTRTTITDAHGNYVCSLPTWQGDSHWNVRAFWQGDMKHAGVESQEDSLLVPGHPNKTKPPAYAMCSG